MRYVGDVHGKYRQYRRIIRGVPESIQVGDLGVGFRRFPHGDPEPNPPHAEMVKHNARFIRGNHDNPAGCERHSQWIEDGEYDGGTMFIGGAYSIDKAFRIEGYSWWPDEELSHERLCFWLSEYERHKPEIMVTHDAPQAIAAEIVRPLLRGNIGQFEMTRTRSALQQMWALHQPKLWIFGHYHVSSDHVLQGTRFICLAELEYIDI